MPTVTTSTNFRSAVIEKKKERGGKAGASNFSSGRRATISSAT